MATLVTGVFKDRLAVESVIEKLIQLGYSAIDIGVLMTDETRTREFGIEAGTKAAEGAGIGGAVGAAVGAVLAAIAAVGTNLIIPGLGLVITGPLGAALLGAGAGGLTGELVGALIGAGVPEYRAEAYEKSLKAGGSWWPWRRNQRRTSTRLKKCSKVSVPKRLASNSCEFVSEQKSIVEFKTALKQEKI